MSHNFTINVQHQNVCEQISGSRSLVLDYYADMDTQTSYRKGKCADYGFAHQYIGGPADVFHVKVTNWGKKLPNGNGNHGHQEEHHHAAAQHHEEQHKKSTSFKEKYAIWIKA